MPASPFTICKHFRHLVCRVMIGVLLFAQMAIAAYACPAMGGMAADMASSAPAGEVAGRPPCMETMPAATQASGMGFSDNQMDPSSPALCAAHCDYGQQSADHADAPTVPAVLLTTLYTLRALTVRIGRIGPLFDQPSPQAASSPPLAILHCCFRI